MFGVVAEHCNEGESTGLVTVVRAEQDNYNDPHTDNVTPHCPAQQQGFGVTIHSVKFHLTEQTTHL